MKQCVPRRLRGRAAFAYPAGTCATPGSAPDPHCEPFQSLGRRLAGADIDFLLRELGEGGFRQAEVAAQNVRGRARDPIRNAEGSEFRKMSVVEAQQKMALTRSQALNGVAVPARKIPGVARLEFGNFSQAGSQN